MVDVRAPTLFHLREQRRDGEGCGVMRVKFSRQWDGPKDADGNFLIYTAGDHIYDVDPLIGAYVVAVQYAEPVGEVPEPLAADITALRELVGQFQQIERVTPTIGDIIRVLQQAGALQPQPA